MCRRFGKSEKGQAAVEFALCLPFMLLILAAVADFGWLFMHELSISMAVREGTRAAIINASSDGAYIDRAKNKVEEIATLCNNGTLDVTVTPSNPREPGEGDIEVKADYNIHMLTPVAKLFFGGMEYEIHSSYTMRAS